MKYLLLVAAFLLGSIITKGQFKEKRLEIGDTLIDVKVNIVENGKIVEKSIAEINKGKLLILDFWATWCSPCVRELKPYAALNHQFKDSLVILPVTREKRNIAATFLSNHFKDTVAIASVIEDSILWHHFPHRIVPHEVWIDSKGIVRAITHSEDVTPENIRLVLNGAFGQFRLKKENMTFNQNHYYHPDDSLILFRSLLTRYDPSIGGYQSGSPSVIISDLDTRITRYFSSNSSAIKLIYIAFENGCNTTLILNRNRIEINVKDTLALLGNEVSNTPIFRQRYKTLQDYYLQSAYSYELIMKEGEPKKKFYRRMFDELNRQLPYNCEVVERKRMAWAIVVDDAKKLKKSTEVFMMRSNHNAETTTLHGVRTEHLEYLLNMLYSIDHVVDRTGLSGTINIDNVHIPWAEDFNVAFDIEKLRKELQANGLDLKRRMEWVKILKISDKIN